MQPVIAAKLARVGRNIGIKPRLYATPVDAGYANRYGYQANISAKLTFKIVPVPAPDGIDELRVIPLFIGKTIAESRELAESLGLDIIVQKVGGILVNTPTETDNVTGQEPHPDKQQFTRLGDEIILIIA